jgi:hypothetical protein
MLDCMIFLLSFYRIKIKTSQQSKVRPIAFFYYRRMTIANSNNNNNNNKLSTRNDKIGSKAEDIQTAASHVKDDPLYFVHGEAGSSEPLPGGVVG